MVISAGGRLRQEGCPEFGVSLGYEACLETKSKTNVSQQRDLTFVQWKVGQVGVRTVVPHSRRRGIPLSSDPPAFPLLEETLSSVSGRSGGVWGFYQEWGQRPTRLLGLPGSQPGLVSW